jgi:PAS domain S-box-containing protein
MTASLPTLPDAATVDAPGVDPVDSGDARPSDSRQRDGRRVLAFASAPIATALTTLDDCRFLEVNDALCELVGYAEAELLVLTGDDLFYPEDIEPMRAEARRQLRDGASSFQVEQRLIRRDGRVILTRVTGSPTPDETGMPRYLVSQIQDITPYRAAGAALRASEARLRLALAAAEMGIWEWDAATSEAHRSPQMPGLFGLPPEDADAPRARYRTVIHPDDHPALRAAHRLVLDGKDRYDATYRVILPDGRERWLRDRGEAHRDADGRLLRVRGVTQDITAAHAAEAALRGSEARYRTLVEQAPGAVYVHPLAAGAGVSYISPQIEPILGYAPAVVLARPGFFTDDAHPDDRAAAAACDTGSAESAESFDARYRVRHADGRWVWLRDRAVLVRDDQGQPLHWQGLLTDVSAEVEAEEQLRAAKEAAEAASEAKDAVLRVVSHDLRTPLTAVSGYAELLRLDGTLNAQQQADADQIVRSAAQLSDLIDGVLDLARARAGALVLDPTDVDLASAIEEVRATLAPQADAKGIGLFTSAPTGLVVRADPLRLRQILLNLAGNAVKFTDSGYVTVEARRRDGGVEVAVRDSGIGIAQEELPLVFDEFRQVGRGRAHGGGAGLGLTIAKRLTELHGGCLLAESVPGLGSTFTFVIPDSATAARPPDPGADR